MQNILDLAFSTKFHLYLSLHLPPISVVEFPIFIPIDLVDIDVVHVLPALAAALELADALAIAVLTRKTLPKKFKPLDRF